MGFFVFKGIYNNMKVIITESQVDRVINTFTRFLNKRKRDGVCNVMVDYDEMMDRFVLNIFFDREYVVKLNDGGKQTKFFRKVVDEYGNLFRDFSEHNPLIYQHYNNC